MSTRLWRHAVTRLEKKDVRSASNGVGVNSSTPGSGPPWRGTCRSGNSLETRSTRRLGNTAVRQTLNSVAGSSMRIWKSSRTLRADSALAALKELGVRSAILTNGSRDMIESALVSSGLGQRIDQVMSADDVRTFKPDPAVYAHAVKTLGFSCAGNRADLLSSLGSGRRDPGAFPDAVGEPNRRKAAGTSGFWPSSRDPDAHRIGAHACCSEIKGGQRGRVAFHKISCAGGRAGSLSGSERIVDREAYSSASGSRPIDCAAFQVTGYRHSGPPIAGAPRLDQDTDSTAALGHPACRRVASSGQGLHGATSRSAGSPTHSQSAAVGKNQPACGCR